MAAIKKITKLPSVKNMISKQKRTKKSLNKKPIKVLKNVDCKSTTTEEIEISIHSDSDIINVDLEQEDYDLDDCANPVRNMDILEKEIFDEIEKLHKKDVGGRTRKVGRL